MYTFFYKFVYSLLRMKCHAISIFDFDIIGLFLMERGKIKLWGGYD